MTYVISSKIYHKRIDISTSPFDNRTDVNGFNKKIKIM